MAEHRSFVLYHNNSPRWAELLKLPVPIDCFRGSHLRFEFRHCSSESHWSKIKAEICLRSKLLSSSLSPQPRTKERRSCLGSPSRL